MSFKNMNINQKLALFAVILGLIAIFGGNPQFKSKLVVDTDELSTQILNNSNMISVFELADKIIKEESGFRLIDLRAESKFNEYHLPVAENISVSNFDEIDMPRNEKYYLISDNDVMAGQAWALLRARGYKAVYVIEGGMKEWENSILYPKLSANANAEEIANFNKLKEVSKYFGGQPQISSDSSANEVKFSMPKPSMPASVPVKKAGKMKKEGC